MILTDREIKNSLNLGLVGISPAPTAAAFASTSVDLTLDRHLRLFRPPTHGLSAAIDPGQTGYQATRLLNEITEPLDIGCDGYDLVPGKLILGWTVETVHLPVIGRLAARVEGKSNLARVGLAVHVTAPTIHSGFKGTIQLEIVNHGPLPIKLRHGMRICQLIFETTLGMPDNAYQGQFLGQQAI